MKVVIIGGSRGIGLELAKQYKEQGHDVIATCRDTNSDLDNLGVTVISGIDVKQDNVGEILSGKIPWKSIDILIHNSGILKSDSFPEVHMDTMRESFEVNSLGPLKTVLGLKDKLIDKSKVGIVTSRVGSIGDNSSSNNYAYRTSKTAANMIGKCLSLDLKDAGVTVGILHPGYVRTEMTKNNGFINADEAAEGMIRELSKLTLEETGTFVHSSGERLPW